MEPAVRHEERIEVGSEAGSEVRSEERTEASCGVVLR